jgi:hypothetical protein
MCTGCLDYIFTKSLPSNNRGMHIQTHRLMGGIYEVRCCDGLRCHIYTAIFIKIGSAIQKLIGRKTDTQDSMVIT